MATMFAACDDTPAGDNGDNGDNGDTPAAATVESITVSYPDDTITVGDPFVKRNIEIVVTYSDNTTKTIKGNATGVTVSDVDTSTIGEKTITVTYSDKTATTTINVTGISYVVTFNQNFENCPSNTTQNVNSGSTVTEPTDPTRTNYIFTGWYQEAACTNEYDFSTPVNGILMLYAGWTQAVATCSFDLNYANAPAAPTAQEIDIGEALTAPTAPTRSHYTFDGWYKEAACTNEYDFTQIVTGNFTLYAKWTLSEVVVSFNHNYSGAAAPTEAVISVNTAVTEPAAPTRTGYTFAGWYQETACTTAYVFSTTVSQDISVYAKWTINKYNVTFNLNYEGAPAAQVESITYNELATAPNPPTRNGYTFAGWYKEAAGTNAFSFSTPITDTTVIYAKWTQEVVAAPVVSFSNNYASGGNFTTQTLTAAGATATKPATDPTRSGFEFGGWYTEASCTNAFVFSTQLYADTTVYAKWYEKFTFEAEYIDLYQKAGVGTSNNTFEEGMLRRDDTANRNASNGAYLTDLYYTGVFVEFDIMSTATTSDVKLVLRLSAEYFEFVLTCQEFVITVNDGEPIQFETIVFGPLDNGGAISQGNDGDLTKRPFSDYTITISLPLLEGLNTIKIQNEDDTAHGGSYTAECAMIDCMYLYAQDGIELTWYRQDRRSDPTDITGLYYYYDKFIEQTA